MGTPEASRTPFPPGPAPLWARPWPREKGGRPGVTLARSARRSEFPGRTPGGSIRRVREQQRRAGREAEPPHQQIPARSIIKSGVTTGTAPNKPAPGFSPPKPPLLPAVACARAVVSGVPFFAFIFKN